MPVGPGSTIDYTITLKNIGNADATGVTITDPVPATRRFVVGRQTAARVAGGKVTWTGLTVPAGGSVAVHFTVTIDRRARRRRSTSIVNDGVTVTADQGVRHDRQPARHADRAAVRRAASTPATQTDGGKVGTIASTTT